MKNKLHRLVAGLFLLVALVTLVPIARLTYFAFTPLQMDSQNPQVIEVHKGENPNEITKMLLDCGAIANGKEFIWLGRLMRHWKRIKAGEYQVSSAMSPIEIFSTLTSGISLAHPITVREGENIYEIAEDLESKKLASRNKFIALCRDPNFMESLGFDKHQLPLTLEGYFFPDTYFFNRTLSDSDIARQMVRHFFSFWGKTEETRSKDLRMTRHQVITLASMIEKETGAPEERPLISSVFHNRLRKGMKLQSDPTTIYGMWQRYTGKIHKSDLLVKNQYNTYAIPALPIGPISNPGKESIHAALFPSDSPYLYFVSHNDGTHQFSRSFEEHNRAVKKFQLDPNARAGRSWRDRLKRPASVPAGY